MSSPLLSVVVPVYFGELVIGKTYERLKQVLLGLEPGCRHEIIFINDGSTDRSFEILSDLSRQDPDVRIVEFSRNFGHQIAVTAGMDYAKGDAVIVIDDDLQDPPEVIPTMVAKWKEGYKVVYGVRAKRKGEGVFKVLTASIFYRLLNKLSDINLPLDVGDFRLMDRSVINTLRDMREQSRYIRGLVAWVGFKQCGIPYERDIRYAGKTNYTLRKMVMFALDGIISFSDKPLRLTGHFGLLVTTLSVLAAIWLIVGRITNPQSAVPGWTSLSIAVLFLGGVQLISIGVLGEYIGRIFRETKQRPLYVVADKLGFGENKDSQ